MLYLIKVKGNGEQKTLKEYINTLTAMESHKNNFQNCAVTYAGNVSCMSQRSIVFDFYYFQYFCLE